MSKSGGRACGQLHLEDRGSLSLWGSEAVFHMVTSWSPLSLQGVEAVCSLCLWHPGTALLCD